MVEARRRRLGLLGQQEVLKLFGWRGRREKWCKRVVSHAGIAYFDDEVGEPETITDSPSGGSHVPGEPVDDTTTGVEPHLRDAFAHLRPPTHLRRYTPPPLPRLHRRSVLGRRLLSVRSCGYLDRTRYTAGLPLRKGSLGRARAQRNWAMVDSPSS